MTLNGRTMLSVDWARELGLRTDTIYARRKRGWTDEQALSVVLLTTGNDKRSPVFRGGFFEGFSNGTKENSESMEKKLRWLTQNREG